MTARLTFLSYTSP